MPWQPFSHLDPAGAAVLSLLPAESTSGIGLMVCFLCLTQFLPPFWKNPSPILHVYAYAL